MLANRLREVLGEIVSNSQGVFVKGKHILDGIFIANECVDDRLKSGKCRVICKLDVERAYDRVDWRFLERVLAKKGFGNRWQR